MKCIDAHAHLTRHPEGFGEVLDSGVFDEIWLMDLSGVDFLAPRLATRDELLAWVRRHPDRLRAFGYIDLDRDPPETVRRLRDLGFCGLKPYKQLHPYDYAGYFPVYAEAEELGIPVLFHTGLIMRGPGCGREAPRRAFGSGNMRPEALAGVAEAFPHLQVISGHMGWPYLAEMEQNMYYYPNISGDVSGYLRSMESLREILDRKAGDGTGRYFNHKLHFATDEFYGTPESNARALRLKTFWEGYFEFVGGFYYRWGGQEERQRFFYDNARAIFSR